MKTFKHISLSILAFCLTIFLGLLIYYHIATKDVALNSSLLTFNERNLTIVDKDFNLIPLGITANEEAVHFEDIPLHTKLAFIDVEDRRFYKHHGFDGKGIARAMLRNVKSHTFKEGASTISQQLIKNSHLTQEKTLKRKLQEGKLTKELEKKYSKNEILTLYLNTIYFGDNCFGLTSAAEYYFNKKPQQLTLAESAMLAGMIKSPNNYSPFRHADKCQKRRACVLKIMKENGSITDEEEAAANNTPLPIAHKKAASYKGYAYFVLDELSALAEKHDFRIGGKIEIETFMDKKLQDFIEKINASDNSCAKTFLCLDNETGGFAAGVSSIGNARRLPGSLIKPLLVYAPALRSSGAIQCGVPTCRVKDSFSSSLRENPKSQICANPSASNRTLRDLRSRCMMCFEWRNCIPRATSNAAILRRVGFSLLFLWISW